MIELKKDVYGQAQGCLEASFPEVSPDAKLTIRFHRTFRIPDDGRDYPLPPSLGTFPLRHIDDFASRAPESWLGRGGVLLPMYQSEAMWLSFRGNHVSERDAAYPFAVKIATGKINAVTGEGWSDGLGRKPQNYLVIPIQPWLDGYCVEKGIIRQFVAMPPGEGYTVEEQLTGSTEVGGMQIEVFPMKRAVFEKRFPKRAFVERSMMLGLMAECAESVAGMGLAAGGRMRQEIYEDAYGLKDWQMKHRSRCFVHIVNSTAWTGITGELPPSRPFSAQDYTKFGLPWFEYYNKEAAALEGAKAFAGVKSVATVAKVKRQSLSANGSVAVRKVLKLRSTLGKDQVREVGTW